MDNKNITNEVGEMDQYINTYSRYGSVPVFYGPKKKWLRKSKYETPSILDKIISASSEDEVKKILDIGNAYKKASPGTIRKWNRAAEKRIRELSRI